MTGDEDEKKVEDENQLNLWYLQFIAFAKEKIDNTKTTLFGARSNDAKSIHHVQTKMPTYNVVREFMNGSTIHTRHIVTWNRLEYQFHEYHLNPNVGDKNKTDTFVTNVAV